MSCNENHTGLNSSSESLDAFAAPASSKSADGLVAGPVEIQERVGSLDLLRGVALLGILPINILGFAWPDEVGSAPLLDPGAGSLDLALWAFDRFVFDTKMISLFSMLFTTIFESFGLGLYGTVHRPMLYVFVLVMWAFKLWFSPLWLGAFLYGPAEWVWRSLTYWKSLPMRPSLS
jgi:uncharacterized membrane protein YeiB